MPIFSVQDQRLRLVKEKRISLESELQKLTEKNLYKIFGLEFVSGRRNREFYLHGFRIDTLGFDPEYKAFVIIEYKRDKSFSVIDQGYAYLALMLNNKADFILEYNEHRNSNLKRHHVNWSQSRVIFIANSFTSHQKSAINFKDLPIELWKVKTYDNDTVLYKQLQSCDSSESIKTLASRPKSTIEKVNKEVRVYTLDDVLADKPEAIVEVVEALSEGILGISSRIKEMPQKLYIVYRTNKNIAEIEVREWNVRVKINAPIDKLKDSRSFCRFVKNIGHYEERASEATIDNAVDVPYVIELIKQSFELNQ